MTDEWGWWSGFALCQPHTDLRCEYFYWYNLIGAIRSCDEGNEPQEVTWMSGEGFTGGTFSSIPEYSIEKRVSFWVIWAI
jgi:hypothetical protein